MERTAALGTLGFIIGAVLVVFLNGPLHVLPDSLSRAVAALSRGREANDAEFTDETPEVEPAVLMIFSILSATFLESLVFRPAPPRGARDKMSSKF